MVISTVSGSLSLASQHTYILTQLFKEGSSSRSINLPGAIATPVTPALPKVSLSNEDFSEV